jgi:hypothetical protein
VKRRLVYVVDDDERARQGLAPFKANTAALARAGVSFEYEEVVPEPDRVQEFIVRITTRATEPAFTVDQVKWMGAAISPRIKDFIVTEVKS